MPQITARTRGRRIFSEKALRSRFKSNVLGSRMQSFGSTGGVDRRGRPAGHAPTMNLLYYRDRVALLVDAYLKGVYFREFQIAILDFFAVDDAQHVEERNTLSLDRLLVVRIERYFHRSPVEQRIAVKDVIAPLFVA